MSPRNEAGIASLIDQVQAMVEASGNPVGFDAEKWLAEWLQQPQPALGDRPPAALMGTAEGQEKVANILARMQSGAFC